MKIRIKGNSIRLRLTKTDVKNLKNFGKIEEKTVFNDTNIFEYTLEIDDNISEISARFDQNKINVFLSKKNAKTLTETNEITVQGNQENGTEKGLLLLIEKDLECLDSTTEDQSDMFKNTKTVC
ncbi:DUF7009 family protein [Halpernia frigidisoli]|uniref:Uncharacterized protein n=1 Tax=Halpernia frigidisoli TaxID=1125876 RepID=A0A1I3FSL1_9FLAO|nr:hypothetical protein [Halpernia frigidisoli]SFI13911.1 hypothetical protein SAMN05443292_1581 [Halpernia frigidisoli]